VSFKDRHANMERNEDPAAIAASVAEAREEKRRRLVDPTRPLDTWERYRALNDAMDEAYDLMDIANNSARFALIIMGALNAVLFVMGTRMDLIASIPLGLRPGFGVGLVLYGIVAIYFFLQAIETLRPRKFRPRLGTDGRRPEERPMGVRYYEDVIDRDTEEHVRAWEEVRIGQLNAELAAQFHSLSLKNQAKAIALRRLYAGLRLMTLLVASAVMLLGYFAFATRQAP
jgi:hypothetical protein